MTTIAELILYLKKFPQDSVVAVNKIISNSNIIDGYDSKMVPYAINIKETTTIEHGGIYADGECITEEEVIDKEIEDNTMKKKNLNYKIIPVKKIQKILILDSQ